MIDLCRTGGPRQEVPWEGPRRRPRSAFLSWHMHCCVARHSHGGAQTVIARRVLQVVDPSRSVASAWRNAGKSSESVFSMRRYRRVRVMPRSSALLRMLPRLRRKLASNSVGDGSTGGGARRPGRPAGGSSMRASRPSASSEPSRSRIIVLSTIAAPGYSAASRTTSEDPANRRSTTGLGPSDRLDRGKRRIRRHGRRIRESQPQANPIHPAALGG